jgi:hypothetical protein
MSEQIMIGIFLRREKNKKRNNPVGTSGLLNEK